MRRGVTVCIFVVQKMTDTTQQRGKLDMCPSLEFQTQGGCPGFVATQVREEQLRGVGETLQERTPGFPMHRPARDSTAFNTVIRRVALAPG